ncbi:MAG TPA: amidohydrolase family protein, partial [Candidatus Aquilonibacter sp.]
KDFALLVNMGMRPTDVLRSATVTAAELIGVNDRGALAPGKRADIVAFNGDPTRDISLMEKSPAMILLGGKRVNAA